MTVRVPQGKKRQTVLMWGRFDPGYSRNRVVREMLRREGFEITDFHPALSAFGDIEATLRGVARPDFVWVPCFRLRDVAAAARWARRKGVPLVFDPLISAYQKRVFERHRFPETSAAARRFLRRERALFALADVVVADTDCHRAFFRDTLGVPDDRLATLFVGASGEFTPAPLPVRAAREPHEVLFYGSFIPLHGARTIVEAARLTHGEPIRWTLLGDGPEKAVCRAAAGDLANVVFEDPIPYERLCGRIHAVDVVLGVFGDTSQAARVMPNKFFQSLASGRPVVTRTSPAYPAAVSASPAVRFVPPADPAALADAVRALCETPGELDGAAADARALLDRVFSQDVLVRQFRHLIRRIFQPAPRVSIVVPVYNVEKYLARCLDSLIAQTERNLEIICVNDGSTDASGSILADYAAKDPRIQVMTQPNAGQAVARNRGMDAATGEFLCFVDSDDAAHPRMVERLLAAIDETDADIAVNRGVAEMDSLVAPPPLRMRRAAFHADALADLVADRRIYSSVWNKLYRTALLKDLRFKMPWHFFEDWPFLVKAFARARRGYALVREPLYFYNRESLTANSTVRGTFSARKVDGYLVGIRDVTELFRGRPEEPFARRRAAAAAKMLMSKARNLEPALQRRAVQGLEAIRADGLLARRDFDLKTRWRIWRIKHG